MRQRPCDRTQTVGDRIASELPHSRSSHCAWRRASERASTVQHPTHTFRLHHCRRARVGHAEFANGGPSGAWYKTCKKQPPLDTGAHKHRVACRTAYNCTVCSHLLLGESTLQERLPGDCKFSGTAFYTYSLAKSGGVRQVELRRRSCRLSLASSPLDGEDTGKCPERSKMDRRAHTLIRPLSPLGRVVDRPWFDRRKIYRPTVRATDRSLQH